MSEPFYPALDHRVEKCLGEVNRVVITAGRFVDHDKPKDQWPMNFMVDLIEVGPDGGEMGMWYGPRHTEAVKVAHAVAKTWGNLPVIDRTRGGLFQ